MKNVVVVLVNKYCCSCCAEKVFLSINEKNVVEQIVLLLLYRSVSDNNVLVEQIACVLFMLYKYWW